MEPNEVFLAEVEEENRQLSTDPAYHAWCALDAIATSLDTRPLMSEAAMRGREAVLFAKVGYTNAARQSAAMAARIYLNALGRINFLHISNNENEEVPF